MKLSQDALCDVLAFFDRDQLDRMEMVSRQFRNLIHHRFAVRPLTKRNPFFIVSVYLPDRYSCELWWRNQEQEFSRRRGSIDDFLPILRRGGIPRALQVRFAAVDDVSYQPQVSPANLLPYTAAVEERLLELRPLCQTAQQRYITMEVGNDDFHHDHFRFINMTFECFDDPSSSTVVEINVRRGGAELFGEMADNAVFAQLLDRKPHKTSLTVEHFDDAAVAHLVRLCRSTPNNPIDELHFGLAHGGAGQWANEQRLRAAFEPLRQIFPRLRLDFLPEKARCTLYFDPMFLPDRR